MDSLPSMFQLLLAVALFSSVLATTPKPRCVYNKLDMEGFDASLVYRLPIEQICEYLCNAIKECKAVVHEGNKDRCRLFKVTPQGATNGGESTLINLYPKEACDHGKQCCYGNGGWFEEKMAPSSEAFFTLLTTPDRNSCTELCLAKEGCAKASFFFGRCMLFDHKLPIALTTEGELSVKNCHENEPLTFTDQCKGDLKKIVEAVQSHHQIPSHPIKSGGLRMMPHPVLLPTLMVCLLVFFG